jgi:hypothetical protein
MRYSIVFFLADNKVEGVPSTWVEVAGTEHMCYFPPSSCNSSKIIHFIKALKLPEINWPKYACNIIGKADSYESCERKAEKARDTDHLSSVSEAEPVAAARLHNHPSSSSEDEEVPPPTPPHHLVTPQQLVTPHLLGKNTNLPKKLFGEYQPA